VPESELAMGRVDPGVAGDVVGGQFVLPVEVELGRLGGIQAVKLEWDTFHGAAQPC